MMGKSDYVREKDAADLGQHLTLKLTCGDKMLVSTYVCSYDQKYVRM